jgi:hypothetical protein
MKTKIFLAVLFGFFAHKAAIEWGNVRAVWDYNKCLAAQTAEAPRYWQHCKHTLEATKLEAIVLWQPNLWQRYDNAH